jgi:RNA polymerase sigma-70 factor (ECF subfamily)
VQKLPRGFSIVNAAALRLVSTWCYSAAWRQNPHRTMPTKVNNKTPNQSTPSSLSSARAAEKDSDFDLVSRCQKGDDAAFNELVTRYQRRVYAIALGMLKNPDDAMDITQEAFVKVYRYLGNFQGTSSFYTWLYRIVVNLCIDHIRKSRKAGHDEYDEKMHGRPHRHQRAVLSSDLGVNPSTNLGRKELAQVMQEAIQTLPPYHRAVILMREVEGMSYAEMADALKISKGTVMSRLHHARQKLQRILEPYLDGDMVVR